ncbi:hypothetical protein ACHAWF_004002 [Thalassiosira exigua]
MAFEIIDDINGSGSGSGSSSEENKMSIANRHDASSKKRRGNRKGGNGKGSGGDDDDGGPSDAKETPKVRSDVDLRELLSTCVDACRRGCEVIRNVRHKSLRSADVLDSVRYKIVDDPRSALTEADGASQKVIVECLNGCWEGEVESGRLRIVGEEDEDQYSTDLEGDQSFDTAYSEDIMNHFDNYGSPRTDLEPMLRDLFGRAKVGGNSEGGATSSRAGVCSKGDEIIIFIDPMDGTREFVEGRIHNVQCLIGVTVNGVPVAGAMGLPMVHANQIEVVYGLIAPSDVEGEPPVPLLSGAKFFDAANPLDLLSAKLPPLRGGGSDSSDEDFDDETLRVFSGDSKKPALKIAMHRLERRALGPSTPLRKIVAGGCGNKILCVQRHSERCARRREEEVAVAASSGGCGFELLFPRPPPPPTVGALSMAPPGSSSWDTAAPTAVLLAADPSARVTDLTGRPLVYDGERLQNERGVVVSSGCVARDVHDRLCRGLGGDRAFEAAIAGAGKAAATAKQADRGEGDCVPPVATVGR